MPNFSNVHIFLPSTVTINADDPAKLEAIASWMTQASPRLAALPGFVDAIQPTWTAQILSNPLGTIRDTAAALGPSGRLATDATRLQQIAQRVRGTDFVHSDLLNRIAGGPGVQTLVAVSPNTPADVQWLADEAAFLEAASVTTDKYAAAAQAVVDNWTPPQGQPDTIRYTLLETRTALYPTPNAVKDMAATLRGVHDRVVATMSANATLAAQLTAAQNPPAGGGGTTPGGGTTSEGGANPGSGGSGGGTTVTVQPAPASTNALAWVVAGVAAVGLGVWAFSRPNRNPTGASTYRVEVKGYEKVPEISTHGGALAIARRLSRQYANTKISIYETTNGTDRLIGTLGG